MKQLLLLVISLCSLNINAMDFEVLESNEETLVLKATGEILPRDEDLLESIVETAKLVHNPKEIVLVLDSGGGAVRTAFNMATLVADMKARTIIEGNCYSACTYVFMAGSERQLEGNLGFHMAWFKTRSTPYSGAELMSEFFEGQLLALEYMLRLTYKVEESKRLRAQFSILKIMEQSKNNNNRIVRVSKEQCKNIGLCT